MRASNGPEFLFYLSCDINAQVSAMKLTRIPNLVPPAKANNVLLGPQHEMLRHPAKKLLVASFMTISLTP